MKTEKQVEQLLKEQAKDIGFKEVEAGPFLRSSYRAKEIFLRYKDVKRSTFR